MQWIKSESKLPPQNKSVNIRLVDDGRIVWEDTATLNYYDGYFWEGENGLYEAEPCIEWSFKN